MTHLVSPFHAHQHEPVGVDNEMVKTTDSDGSVTEAPVTYVLRRCKCGDVETGELDGTWTLAQIRPPGR
jgi:hypothetical protein